MTNAHILICDHVGLRFDATGRPDSSDVETYIRSKGGIFHHGGIHASNVLEPNRFHFFYQPELSGPDEILKVSAEGQYDSVIAAASHVPERSRFRFGGVRIGAGTGNMMSASWGGCSGKGGTAPLMNTPGVNSRATAQMVFKSLLRVRPDLPVDKLHQLVVAGDFDTRRQLRDYPTDKLEGKTLGIAGFGHIGREVALLGRAFAMKVVIFARAHRKEQIEAEGYHYATTVETAAENADVFSVHLGRGAYHEETGDFKNDGLIADNVLTKLKHGAVLINFDRGELVNVHALRRAMASGKVANASIDADLFKDPVTGALSGPMVPYLSLVDNFADRLELLPHAAADTDHGSRVNGAKMAVDQVFAAIGHKSLSNLVGSVPEGYVVAHATDPLMG